MSEKRTGRINKKLKELGPIAAVLVAVPAVILLAPFALTYGAIKDSLKTCPKCRSRKLELKGHTFKPGTARCLVTHETSDGDETSSRPDTSRRVSPCYEFYVCQNCDTKTKKLFAQSLEPCTDEEFAKLVPVEKT